MKLIFSWSCSIITQINCIFKAISIICTSFEENIRTKYVTLCKSRFMPDYIRIISRCCYFGDDDNVSFLLNLIVCPKLAPLSVLLLKTTPLIASCHTTYTLFPDADFEESLVVQYCSYINRLSKVSSIICTSFKYYFTIIFWRMLPYYIYIIARYRYLRIN